VAWRLQALIFLSRSLECVLPSITTATRSFTSYSALYFRFLSSIIIPYFLRANLYNRFGASRIGSMSLSNRLGRSPKRLRLSRIPATLRSPKIILRRVTAELPLPCYFSRTDLRSALPFRKDLTDEWV
jgi:hypothetical protein